ncbi:hypothetical protein ACP4OV_005541 [Aristida adscensionis]
MNKLANMFAAVNLDAEDDGVEVEKPASSKTGPDAATSKNGENASPLFPGWNFAAQQCTRVCERVLWHVSFDPSSSQSHGRADTAYDVDLVHRLVEHADCRRRPAPSAGPAASGVLQRHYDGRRSVIWAERVTRTANYPRPSSGPGRLGATSSIGGVSQWRRQQAPAECARSDNRELRAGHESGNARD